MPLKRYPDLIPNLEFRWNLNEIPRARWKRGPDERQRICEIRRSRVSHVN